MEDFNSNICNVTKVFTLVEFEPEVIEKWIDPFDSIALKFLTVFVYFNH